MLRGLKDHAERAGQGKRAGSDHLRRRDGRRRRACSPCSCASRNSRARPRTASPPPRRRRSSNRRSRIRSITGSPAIRCRPTSCSNSSSSAPRSACAAAQEKEISRKSAVKKLRLPGKLADCTNTRAGRLRTLHRRGRLRRRQRQAGARPRDPGDPAAARQDPQRRLRRQGQADRQPAARRPDAGARLRHRRALSRGRSALLARHHHDRRRRRRRAHRFAADHLLLPADAAADRRGPPLSRRAAALPAEPRRQDVLRARRQAQGRDARTASSAPTPRSRSAASRASAK